MKKSKILEEKCKSQKGGLFINAFDAYHSLALPRVEGWANFGKAGPRINHDKNISFLAITPSSPLLYITSPPTLLLPTRSPPLCQKDLYVLGPSVLGLKNLAISRKINLPRILRDILDIFGLVHMPKLGMSFEMFLAWYIFGISCLVDFEHPGLRKMPKLGLSCAVLCGQWS